MSFTYKGLKAVLERHIVTDTEVERQIQRLQQQYPRVASITDRATQLGDEVILDYAGFCDGEQFAGGTAEKQTLVLGSGMFIPGFEEQLLDKVPGEDVVVKVTFPTEYHAPDLAGKEAEFRCHLHEIRVKTACELDDTFAKEVGQCETMDEMREKMKQSLQAYADEQGEMDLQDQLIRMAADTLELEISAEELKAGVEEQISTMTAQLAQQGLNLEMYCSFMNTTEEQLRIDAEESAKAAIRIKAATDKIAEQEKLEATQEEIGVACATIARQNNMTIEQLKPYYDAEFEAAVIRTVLMSKAMKVVRDAAEITEK